MTFILLPLVVLALAVGFSVQYLSRRGQRQVSNRAENSRAFLTISGG
jgi:hypothetical protein